MIPITRMIQTADTLRYLYLGGRIGRAKQLVGSLLNIKPLIGMDDGVIVPLGQARSLGRAYQMMVERVEAAVGRMGKIKVAYVHAGARQEVERLKGLVEERITCVEALITELSPALAVHTGPGTSGLCYFPWRAEAARMGEDAGLNGSAARVLLRPPPSFEDPAPRCAVWALSARARRAGVSFGRPTWAGIPRA